MAPARHWLSISTAILAVSLTGCAAADTGTERAAPPAPSHSHGSSSPAKMAAMSANREPSDAARMICSPDIQGQVARVFALDHIPPPKTSWTGQVYTCTYELPAGKFVLSVQDASTPAAGMKYFRKFQHDLGGAEPIRGVLSFGLPAISTPNSVAFLKDGKTLTVDATDLPRHAGPDQQSRSDVAYAVAATVIACWREHPPA
jgi:hypothetical protein